MHSPEQRIPLFAQARILDSLDGHTLALLGLGLLENDIPLRAKHLINAASSRTNPDPLALYLCGLTIRSAQQGYIPALYICAKDCLKYASSSLSQQQQEKLSCLFKTLDKYALCDEQALPLLQQKALRAGCRILDRGNRTDEFVLRQDIPFQKTFQNAYTLLETLVGLYLGNPTSLMKPWACRACYILAILHEQEFNSSITAQRTIDQYLNASACENFEPAIHELIHLRIKSNPALEAQLEEQFNNFFKAWNFLKTYDTSNQEKSYRKRVLKSLSTAYAFLGTFKSHIQDLPLYATFVETSIRTASSIAKQGQDYRTQCLLALFHILKEEPNSITNAFACLEPVINNPNIAKLLAHHAQIIQPILEQSASTAPHASFILGLIASSGKTTLTQAFQYFKQGAAKEHFYCLLCAANMIKKQLIPDCAIEAAIPYYQKALVLAPSQITRNYVLSIIQELAKTPCIAAQCLYFIALLDDPSYITKCTNILSTIEEASQDIFNKYIACFTHNHIQTLRTLTEQGNGLATRILGYIHYARAEQSDFFNLMELHTILGKLRNASLSPRSTALAADIAYKLACYYQEQGNTSNASRLFAIAADYGNEPSQCICALQRVQQGTSTDIKNDLKKIQMYADQENLDAQLFLVKLYYGLIDPLNKKAYKPNFALAYKYLENLVTHGTTDASLYALLAKQIYAKITDVTKDDVLKKTYELFEKALEKGYRLTRDEHKIFGTIAYVLKHDNHALASLEQCEQDPYVLWYKAVIYLRTEPKTPEIISSAMSILKSLLIIDNDQICLPQKDDPNISSVYEILYFLSSSDRTVQEIFMRFCYAAGFDETKIPSQYLNLTETTPLSLKNFIIFLHRHGIWASKSLQIAIQHLPIILDQSNPDSIEHKEAINQLEYIADFLCLTYTLSEELVAAIYASFLLTKYCTAENNLSIYKYFLLAEKAIGLLPTSQQFSNLAHRLEAVDALKNIVDKKKSSDAAATLTIYLDSRVSDRSDTLSTDIKLWFEKCDAILNKHVKTYHFGENTNRDTMYAAAFNILGRFKIACTEHNKQIQAIPYFELAVRLDPELYPALYNRAYLYIHNGTTDEQVRLGIKYMKKLADMHNPGACFELGVLYSPLSEERIVNPNKKTAQEYLQKAAQAGHIKAQQALKALTESGKKRSKESKKVPSTSSLSLLQRIEGLLQIAITNQEWPKSLELSDMILQIRLIPIIAMGAADIALHRMHDIGAATRYLLKAIDGTPSCKDKEFRETFYVLYEQIITSEDPKAQQLASLIIAYMQKHEIEVSTTR